ncbi:hypothetical protein [Pseudonocardia sp. TRM90224]|uniref:hypothetical protein n=1 Tax=Pseudonocardia sp. TRM90224 TaxID=2812678 RepID=UPI001E48454F|nr:hypothetical protein [Pseudonocardia sp. TRM90224]
MPDEGVHAAAPEYAMGQLTRAITRAVESGTAEDRERALAKVRRWQDVLSGMESGRLAVGSRTPVAGTPAWVTLEVAHGGFATGRYLAESPLTDAERHRLDTLPPRIPGETDRERLNLWYLGDDGQSELLAALRSGHYRVEVPEEAAIAVAVLLVEQGFAEHALDLVAELRPLMHRLRFTPRFEPVALPSGTSVRLVSVGEVSDALRAVRTPPQIAQMNDTLQVWGPLYDRLVELWCATVEGELPSLDATGAVTGGWPCRRWPQDWAGDRARWLTDYADAARLHPVAGRYAHPKSNFTRMRVALEWCPEGSGALSARDVGWVRRALANTVSRRGAPGSERRVALRETQAAVASIPTRAGLAGVVVGRLAGFRADGGIPALAAITAAVSADEPAASAVPAGTAIPDNLVRKAVRALEAPVDELVAHGVITSNEVLATVLPQITSRLLSAAIPDPVVAGLHEQLYTAFRRRRGLLLLDLAQQVRFEELPWVAALVPFVAARSDVATAAYRALQQSTMLALTSFPQELVPNPLVTEFRAMATQAGLQLPLVEEIAADIFMGTFTDKWRLAAGVASAALEGTLYARYYDLPEQASWTSPARPARKWGKVVARDFAEVCAERAQEAGRGGGRVAGNGTLLEQSQILTTHNLAVLVAGLDLTEPLRERAPELAWTTFRWVVHRLAQSAPHRHAALIQVKNAAYAWRQAIFLLGLCGQEEQERQAHLLAAEATAAGIGKRFRPATDGLAHVVGGGRFGSHGKAWGRDGRRFLGWSAGRHWFLEDAIAGSASRT